MRFLYWILNYYFTCESGCKVLWWVCRSVCLCVCLSASISLEPHVWSLPNLLCMLPMSLARSSFGMFMIGHIAYHWEAVFFPTENALCKEYKVEGSRPWGRPKRTWREVVQKDCQARSLNREDSMDHSRWKKLIKIGSSSRMMGGWMFLLVPAHPGSRRQRAVKRLLLLLKMHHKPGNGDRSAQLG